MKASACTAILMAIATFLSAYTTPISDTGSHAGFLKCREYATGTEIDLPRSALVEHDLLNGRWTAYDCDGTARTYHFGVDGTAGILVRHPSGNMSYELSNWRMEASGSVPVLVLKNIDGNEHFFSVEQTCEGIELVNLYCETSVNLSYAPVEKSGEVQKFRSCLSGEWTNVTFFENADKKCENTDGAFLSYNFSSGGTYSCLYGSNLTTIRKTGRWELSGDCQFLILHEENVGNEDPVIKIMRIVEIDQHGLIIEQVMKSSEINNFFCTDTKTFAFIK